MFHQSNIGTVSTNCDTTGFSIPQRAEPTLQDLMRYAGAKSSGMSSANSKRRLYEVLLQNRFVANINAAVQRYPLNILVSSIDQPTLPSCPSEDLSAELPSCPSEHLSAELPSCPSEHLSAELPSCPSEHLSAELTSNKILLMGIIAEVDEDVYSEEEVVNDTWIGQNSESEYDDAIFDRLMKEYDEKERLYQKYNRYGHSNENIDTCLGMPVDPNEEMFTENFW